MGVRPAAGVPVTRGGHAGAGPVGIRNRWPVTRRGQRPTSPVAACPKSVRSGSATAVVWTVDLTDPRWDVDEAAHALHPDELRRADQASPAVRRRRILLRAALRRVLADVLRTAPREVPLLVDGGRPLLHPESRPQLGISCSASAGVADSPA